MFNTNSVDIIWLVLMGLTLLGAAIAESPDQGLLLILVITFTVAYKGRMNVVVYLFPDLIVRFTTLQ